MYRFGWRELGPIHAGLGEAGVEERCQVTLAHLLFEGSVGGVPEGLETERLCGGDVVFAVVEEEDVGRRGAEGFGGFQEYFRLGLGHVEGVGPRAVVEAGEPREPGHDALGHAVPDVGEDAGPDASVLQTGGPLDHRQVKAAPEVDVGGEQVFELRRGEGDSGAVGDCLPVAGAGEGGAIIVVAEVPVGGVEGGFVEAGDVEQARPCGGIGRVRENLAVVEQDGVDARSRVCGGFF
jgi:hypothetical protein